MINIKSVVMTIANGEKGNRSERLKESWRVVRNICGIIEPDNQFYLDIGMCPKCLTGNWLIKDSKTDITQCLSCGGMFAPWVLEE